MYERFTEQARKVMQLANQEAQRFNHEYIGSEHILIGIIKGGTGIGAAVLKQSGIDLHGARLATEKLLGTGPEQITIGKLLQTPDAKDVIERSMKHAREMNHNYVCTEHILLAMIGGQTGAAAVLRELNVDLEQTRADILSRIPDDEPAEAESESSLTPESSPEKPSTGKRLSRKEKNQMRKEQMKARRSSAPIPSESAPANRKPRWHISPSSGFPR